MKYINLKLIFVLGLLLTFSTKLLAGGTDLETGSGINPIQIPLFSSTALDFVGNASIISWLAFAGSVVTVAILVFWVLRILISGVGALRSEGDQTKLQESYGKLKSNFTGMFITFLIPLILSIVGAFFGIGTIFDWPSSFQFCENSEYRFYFEAYLKTGSREQADYTCNINGANREIERCQQGSC